MPRELIVEFRGCMCVSDQGLVRNISRTVEGSVKGGFTGWGTRLRC